MPEEFQMPDKGQGLEDALGITPQLVRKVSERVYAMLMADLRLESERYRGLQAEHRRSVDWKGGR